MIKTTWCVPKRNMIKTRRFVPGRNTLKTTRLVPWWNMVATTPFLPSRVMVKTSLSFPKKINKTDRTYCGISPHKFLPQKHYTIDSFKKPTSHKIRLVIVRSKLVSNIIFLFLRFHFFKHVFLDTFLLENIKNYILVKFYSSRTKLGFCTFLTIPVNQPAVVSGLILSPTIFFW